MIDRLYAVAAGRMQVIRRHVADRIVPVVVYVAVGADRVILVDTGFSPLAAADPARHWGAASRFYRPLLDPGEDLLSRLGTIGLEAGDITDIAMTHLHRDHAGGLHQFPGARVWVQRTEYREASHPDPHLAEEYADEDFALAALEYQLMPGDGPIATGVFGLRTPGHTAGHQAVLVRLASGWVCITGDAADTRKQVDLRRPLRIAASQADAMASVDRLTLLENAFGARLLFAHDGEQLATLPPFPAYVD